MNNDFILELEKEYYLILFELEDLFNDFNFVRNLNSDISYRFEMLVSILPTLEEVEFLIKNSKNEDRIKKLKMLKLFIERYFKDEILSNKKLEMPKLEDV